MSENLQKIEFNHTSKNILVLQDLTKTFNTDKTVAVSELSLNIKRNSITAIVGESGSGKTTLCRLIAGLETPDKGSIQINNKVVSSTTVFTPPEKRNIGMVFQDYALFPHLTLYKNIAYGVTKRVDKAKRVIDLLDLVGLKDLEKRYPHQLSGGQQQRVALARALAPSPDILILDEPFSNLDANFRVKLRKEIFQIIKQTQVTALFITHDTDDATAVADEIVIIKDGVLVQHDATKVIMEQPKNSYVASLFSRS
jgi:iron(III) transport system ATP-binding protein